MLEGEEALTFRNGTQLRVQAGEAWLHPGPVPAEERQVASGASETPEAIGLLSHVSDEFSQVLFLPSDN